MVDMLLFGVIQVAVCYLCYSKGKGETVNNVMKAYSIGYKTGTETVLTQLELLTSKDQTNEQTAE